MDKFKMKDVEYRKVLVWNPDCMTKHVEWGAFLNNEIIARAYAKEVLLDRVRRIRKGEWNPFWL